MSDEEKLTSAQTGIRWLSRVLQAETLPGDFSLHVMHGPLETLTSFSLGGVPLDPSSEPAQALIMILNVVSAVMAHHLAEQVMTASDGEFEALIARAETEGAIASFPSLDPAALRRAREESAPLRAAKEAMSHDDTPGMLAALTASGDPRAQKLAALIASSEREPNGAALTGGDGVQALADDGMSGPYL
jgi:hypothetical protein